MEESKEEHLGRRRHFRIKATYLVCYRAKFTDTAYSHYQYALTKDISAGGMLVMSEEIFPKGTLIEMIIRLPMYPDKQIEAKGEVTTHKNTEGAKALYPLRLRFLDFDEHAFKKLTGHIEEETQKTDEQGQTLPETTDRRKSQRSDGEDQK